MIELSNPVDLSVALDDHDASRAVAGVEPYIMSEGEARSLRALITKARKPTPARAETTARIVEPALLVSTSNASASAKDTADTPTTPAITTRTISRRSMLLGGLGVSAFSIALVLSKMVKKRPVRAKKKPAAPRAPAKGAAGAPKPAASK